MVKNLPANAGDPRDRASISESGRSPGVENGNLLQYSFFFFIYHFFFICGGFCHTLK